MPACASAASWNAVKSQWPSQRLPAPRERGEVEAVEQPRPAVAAAHGDRRRRRRGSSAMRMIAARRSSSRPAKRCQRARARRIDDDAMAERASRATARSIAAGSVAKPGRRVEADAESAHHALTPRGEELGQQRAALVGAHAAGHRRVMVEPRLGEEVDHRAAGAGLRIARAEDERARCRACRIAPAHIAHGSSVTYSAQSGSR